MTGGVNPAWLVRLTGDTFVELPGGPVKVPAGTEGVANPIALATGQRRVNVTFPAPYAPRYGPNVVPVERSAVELVHPDLYAKATDQTQWGNHDLD